MLNPAIHDTAPFRKAVICCRKVLHCICSPTVGSSGSGVSPSTGASLVGSGAGCVSSTTGVSSAAVFVWNIAGVSGCAAVPIAPSSSAASSRRTIPTRFMLFMLILFQCLDLPAVLAQHLLRCFEQPPDRHAVIRRKRGDLPDLRPQMVEALLHAA